MTQLVPSYLVYEQAYSLLSELNDEYRSGALQNVDDVVSRLREIITNFSSTIGGPIFRFDPVVETEPPLSSKYNRAMAAIQSDIQGLQNQVDMLRASTIFTFNLINEEVLKQQNGNLKSLNKLKTLQLYSSSTDTNVVQFGGTFSSLDFFDSKYTPDIERASVVGTGILTLGRQGELKNLARDSVVGVSEGSNGFLGNNQEIEDPASVVEDGVTDTPQYSFVAETVPANNLNAVKDGSPGTWIEYEHCFVSEQDKLSAGGLNFSYRNQNTAEADQQLVPWANGPAGGVLKLSLDFDLKTAQKINHITYSPYGLPDNRNYPVKVRRIQTSVDGTTWVSVHPDNVWIGTDSSMKTLRTGEDLVLGAGTWSFEEAFARYVRIDVEQPNSINAKIGHLYYEDRTTGQRTEGPYPSLSNPTAAYNPRNLTQNNLVEKREFFNGKRWAIGVRDIAIEQIQYAPKSSIVTMPIRAGGIIDRVAIDADIYVPPGFSEENSWIQFSISPNDGADWFDIARIQDDFLGLPEVIAFNDPTPEEFREPGVAYYKVSNSVTSVRLKVTLERPSNITYSSPYVRNYNVRIIRRS